MREPLRDGDLVRDAQTGRLWVVESDGNDIHGGSTRVRVVWTTFSGGRTCWIPTHKLTRVTDEAEETA